MEKRLLYEIPSEANRTIHPGYLYKNVDNASFSARPLPHFIEPGSTGIWHDGLVDARRKQKWKTASFSARRGWQRGDHFLRNLVNPNLLVSYFLSLSFSQPVWREPELTWTICAFEFKRSVCCGKATGGKARGRQFGANLVLPYVVRTVHIFAWAVEAFS